MEEEVELMEKEAKAKAEQQRRKDALLTQMYSGWKRIPIEEEASPAQPTPSSPKRGRRLQATVETDTEESPGTNTGYDRPKKTQSVHCKETDPLPPVPDSKPKQDPPPSLKKREGVYTHAPPLEFAREKIVTSALHLQPSDHASTARPHTGRSKKTVAIWSGDEVHIVDLDPNGPSRTLPPPRTRAHRRIF